MTVSKRLRYEVMRRDDFMCRYCGAEAPDAKLTIDHVNPIALGGSDRPENLVTACSACNSGKSSAIADPRVVGDVANNAVRWKQAVELAAEIRLAEMVHMDEIVWHFDARWLGWHVGDDDEQKVPRPSDWRDTIKRFVGLGVDSAMLIEFLEVAMNKPSVKPRDTWAYFCGCCWRYLDQLHEDAQRLLDAGEVVTGAS